MKRGQAAFEYLILVGVLLVLLIPLFHFVSYRSSQDLKIGQTQDTVQTLAKTADTLYTLGPGNRDYVWVNIPGSVSETKVQGNEILIKTRLFGDETDFYAVTKATVSGSLPTEKGRYRIELEVNNTGVVNIEKAT